MALHWLIVPNSLTSIELGRAHPHYPSPVHVFTSRGEMLIILVIRNIFMFLILVMMGMRDVVAISCCGCGCCCSCGGVSSERGHGAAGGLPAPRPGLQLQQQRLQHLARPNIFLNASNIFIGHLLPLDQRVVVVAALLREAVQLLGGRLLPPRAPPAAKMYAHND